MCLTCGSWNYSQIYQLDTELQTSSKAIQHLGSGRALTVAIWKLRSSIDHIKYVFRLNGMDIFRTYEQDAEYVPISHFNMQRQYPSKIFSHHIAKATVDRLPNSYGGLFPHSSPGMLSTAVESLEKTLNQFYGAMCCLSPYTDQSIITAIGSLKSVLLLKTRMLIY